ncbi:MAG: shikimate dehydrogenase [Dehalococcoidia bacterium]|nr:shikimate dehydrogenase [Dehalococcoidia bacterium]
MRILALDVGQQRIGTAIGDTRGGIATPGDALLRVSRAKDVQAILELVRREGAEQIVVGVPYLADRSVGVRGRAVLAFVEALRSGSALPVELWDERFSTVQAEAGLRAAGRQPSRDRARLDSASAAVVLQGYLDAHRTTPSRSGVQQVRLGIIGYPLRHTLSPVFQQAALEACGIEGRYEAWETPPQHLAQQVRELAEAGVLGFNVTVPHKEAVGALLDELTGRARELGAVNTVVNRGGRLVGDNTDGEGFLRALKDDGGFEVKGAPVLVLGAGGAARAVVYSLAKEGAAFIVVANRTVGRAEALVAGLKGHVARTEAAPLTETALRRAFRAEPPLLIVNCTPMGMAYGPAPDQSPLSAGLIPRGALVYDLVYRPAETRLLREARRAGARTLGGLPMLIYQGAAAFRIWTGREPPVAVMLAAARQALAMEG